MVPSKYFLTIEWIHSSHFNVNTRKERVQGFRREGHDLRETHKYIYRFIVREVETQDSEEREVNTREQEPRRGVGSRGGRWEGKKSEPLERNEP